MRERFSSLPISNEGEGTLARWLLGFSILTGGVLIGFIVARANFLVLAVLVGALLVPIVISSRPVVGLWMLLAATALTSYYGSLPFTSVRSILLPDLLLVFVFMVCGIHVLKGRMRFVSTPLHFPFFLLLGAVFVSLGYSMMTQGAILFEALREFKLYGYYAIFLVVPSLIRDPASLKDFMTGCFGVGLLASLNLIIGGILHPPDLNASEEGVFYGFSGMTTEGGGGILIFWSVCCLASLLLIDRVRPSYLGALGILLLYYVLKFHRHMYLIVGFSFVLIGMIAYSRYRTRLSKVIGVGLIAALVGIAAIFWGPGVLFRYAQLSIKRLASLHGIESTSTVTIRLLENHYAIKSIKDHPLTGIGFATRYRPDIYGPNDQLYTFVHNGFLWILVKIGVIGFAMFVWFSGLFVVRALRSWRQGTDPFQKAIVLGSVVAFLGMALANLTSPYFMQEWGVCAFGLMIGVCEAARRMNRQGQRGTA